MKRSKKQKPTRKKLEVKQQRVRRLGNDELPAVTGGSPGVDDGPYNTCSKTQITAA